MRAKEIQVDDVANYDIRPETWCEVTGRGSGMALDGVHHVDTARPYGQMTTFCGVVVSVVVPAYRPRPGSTCRACRRRTSAP